MQEIAAYFTSRYGERIAHDIGIDPRLHPIDMNGVRAAVGVGEDVEALTYRDRACNAYYLPPGVT